MQASSGSRERQFNHDCGPLASLALHCDRALVRSDDVTGNTEPQPHTLALRLGSEEGGKNMREMFRGDTWTGISNLNAEILLALGSLEAEFACAAIIGHGLTGIIEDMQKHLVQLWRIEQDRGQIWRQFSLNFNVA